ncbi:MAG TPA: hypothetical protein VKZ18_05030 [Polyangia bacterium]|nr:hypothetical protein [Polyangia bacterium]
MLALLMVGGTGCGGSNASGGTGGGSGSGNPGVGSTSGAGGSASMGDPNDLSAPAVSVQGGAAIASGGQGQNGGLVHLLAQGDISFDPTMAPAAASVPSAPSGATAVAASALAADASITGDAVVSGKVQSGGSDAVRKLSVSGNLYVTGTLQSADLGSAGQGLDLVVGGSVYVTGTITSAGAAGSGEAAGPITVQAGGDVVLDGKVLLRGGDSATQGGAGAKLTIDANGAVQLGGVIDARGGPATGSGGTLAGGAAGEIHVGEMAAPTAITIFVPVIASGGPGGAAAGKGGTITPEPNAGNVNVAGAMEIDLRGGDSMSAPGTGGLLNGGPRQDPGSGGVHITGEIVASGGSITMGGSGNGADGGRVDMELTPTDGAVAIDAGAKITAKGGDAHGAGTAGGGGHVWFFTKDGDETIAGTVDTSGGDASDPGGVGGGGGMIYFFSDNNHNGVQVCKGNLWVTSTGLLVSSGGNGTMGGSARNNGTGNGVASFPDMQETFAVFLNCDGEHGNTCNWMKNDGQVTARGGVHDGTGGDVCYHGIPPGVLGTGGPNSGDYPVPPGMVDNSGDGSGKQGDFAGE